MEQHRSEPVHEQFRKLIALTADEQHGRWPPGRCSAELVTATAMSEPSAGFDLTGVATSTVHDMYVLNGQTASGGYRFRRTGPDTEVEVPDTQVPDTAVTSRQEIVGREPGL